jgi:chromosome segregation ATPase
MVQNVTEKVTELTLPFSVPSETRKELFTKAMERAAVFCLAELERRKGTGFVLKKAPREFEFIIEVGYPIWLVPYGQVSFVFDGLKVASYTLVYQKVPNIENFINGLKRSSATREAYAAFLTDNLNYFQTSDNQMEKTIEGLITDSNFLQDFNSYLSEARRVKPTVSDMVFLEPTLNEDAVFYIKRELEDFKKRFTEDANSLYKGMKLINTITKKHIDVVQREIKKVKEEFRVKLEEKKPAVMEKVEKIRRQYDEQVTRVSKRFEKEIYRLQQEKVKLEKAKALLLSKIERCETEIETCIVNKDPSEERRWKEELEQNRKELTKIEKEIREVEEKIKVPESAKRKEISRLKAECETRVDEVSWELREIEASRDAKIRIYEEEIKKLQEQTETIIGQMNRLAKLREATLDQLKKLGINQKRKRCTLVYISFYVVCYRVGFKRQYMVYSPSIANNMKLSIKLKGTLGRARIKQLFAQRSKAISSLIGKFPIILEQNAVFEREINEAGAKANIISSGLRESVMSGLERLKEEGWLSKEEHEAFSQILSQ